jgi:hypothetical protein
MPRTIKCSNCDAPFSEAISPCKWCGGTIELSITLTGIESKSATGRVGIVNDTNSEDGQYIKYTAPTGAQSDSSLVGSLLTILVKPPVDIGRPGEPRVLACIENSLKMTGKTLTPPLENMRARDNRGEHGVLIIDGNHVTLQIVTAKPDASFWKSVANGAGEARVEISEAAKWINNAVSGKAQHYQNEFKFSMLLAVDVGHMGVLASSRVGAQYLQTYGDPTIQYGFGGVWLIGPTENNILYLGNSRW